MPHYDFQRFIFMVLGHIPGTSDVALIACSSTALFRLESVIATHLIFNSIFRSKRVRGKVLNVFSSTTCTPNSGIPQSIED